MDPSFSKGFWNELLKLADIDPADLQQSVDRLEKLEKEPPNMDQLRRYAGVGAVLTPVASALEKAVSGDPILARGPNNKIRWGGSLRQQVGKSLGGAIGAGVIPILRHRIDHGLEKKELQRKLDRFTRAQEKEEQAEKALAAAAPLGMVPKEASALIPSADGSAKSRLRAAKNVGRPRMTNLAGPSISSLSKPEGYGLAHPGTTKGQI